MISKIYNSPYYIISVVILALISLFEQLPGILDWSVYGVFIFDLVVGTGIWIKSEEKKSINNYFKHFTLDIIACIPVANFGILKIFRLIRVSRLVKLKRLEETSAKINVENFFSIGTIKQLAIYLLIYFIANIYIFDEIEHKSIIDGIYWLVETMTSVGYGDITPTHASTKILGIFLMIIGVATIGYINGVITTTVVRSLNKNK